MNLKLYDFQTEAYKKLLNAPSRLLADDMGLGKTVEALALDFGNRQQLITTYSKDVARRARTLIITPKSTFGVWQHHIKTYAPKARTVILNTHNAQTLLETDPNNPNFAHYLITNPEQLIRLPITTLRAQNRNHFDFFHIVADECHRFKNRKAKQTTALKHIKTMYKTGMSGTPADDKPHDLWSILHWLYPQVYTSYWRFFNHFVKFTEEYGPHGTYKRVIGYRNLDQLRSNIEPFYIRRLKTDVAKQIPPKTYHTIPVTLHATQRKAYDQMLADEIATLQDDNDMVSMYPITKLLRLQQFALAPMRVDPDNPTRIYRKPDGTTEEVTNYQPHITAAHPSAKLDALKDFCSDAIAQGQCVVVFSQFSKWISLVTKELNKITDVTAEEITGSTTQAQRNQRIHNFQDKGTTNVLVCNIKAMGVGVTLTRASNLVFTDRSWNPSANIQAEDRIHRIGQTNPCLIVDLVATDTVDNGRNQQIMTKAEALEFLTPTGTVVYGA